MTGGTQTELHFHLLPGVDDGPRTLDEALALARLAVDDGTATVVCTPHAHMVDVESLPDRVAEVTAALRTEGIALNLHVGGEISAGTIFTAAELEVLSHGPRDRRWLLLEAPLAPALLDAFHADADEYEDRGYGLLIGHPERCAPLLAPGGGLEARLRRGARLQVNASSVAGAHGEAAQAAAVDLVARGLVSALASDAHGIHRPPLLRRALDLLAGHGLDGGRLAGEGPRRLLREGIASPAGARVPTPAA